MAHRENTSPGRLFRLIRDQDPTGVAGTGHVASGVQWPDGSVTLKWHTYPSAPASVAHHQTVTHMLAVHGHGGKTRVVWVKAANEGSAAAKLLTELSDFAFYLGDFAEKAEKGLNPPADTIRSVFGRLLDIANEAKPAA